MVALRIIETKPFMSQLLKGHLFDLCEGRQIEIRTYIKFTLDCKINKDFYDNDALEALQNTSYALWSRLKESVFTLIKGNKTPTEMKIVLSSPLETLEDIDTSNVDGLFINIHFEKGEAIITTGTSMKIFTLDKSIDHYWDTKIKDLLIKNGIIFEEK